MTAAAFQHDEGVRAEDHARAIGVYEDKAFGSGNLTALVSAVPVVGGAWAGLADSYYNYMENPTPNPYLAEGDDAQRRLIDRMLTDERLYRSVLEGVVESRPELVDAAPLPVDIQGIGPDRNGLGVTDLAALDKWMREAGIPFADFRLHLMGASGYGWSE
ncbi:hypothetical protein [Millisia brevis]|uniref:hypothetical protein n=1 Tax=Millisia brevis TaxID=264148 RepID=UPI00082B3A49|nr:hypothetical protein [Millisia brevis]